MYLFERIEEAKTFASYEELPKLIPDNLNPSFELRGYQKDAFRNFITYFENDKLRQRPSHVLFHMATGSGKTLIMAGLMLYLFDKGYRNFLFFVNLDNIVQKTKVNFLDKTSLKYLFANELNLNGQMVKVREVDNFQSSDKDSINICFTTTQGLHSDVWISKEGSMTFDDFSERDVVFISDEAHHLNADTRKVGKVDDSAKSWEYTVTEIFQKNPKNIMLEFTATCDLANAAIKSKYEKKIVFDYPLKRFREDGFSKEVKTLQSHMPLMDRAIQAILLSQYRLKVFQEFHLYIKPVVLFKHKTIAESKKFQEDFARCIATLTAQQMQNMAVGASHPTLVRMYDYFASKGISFDQLAQELKDDFGPEHCISVNEDKEATESQVIVNTLEDLNNPYRAIFEVKKLDEGWDVLNLFDIVRLYETRDTKNGNPGPATIAEAQLIGRGARYCPFAMPLYDDKYRRKFDRDLDNPLRVCEELYYHCQNDSKYISELTTALKETGIMADNVVELEHKLKDDFKSDYLYQKGIVFANHKKTRDRSEVHSMPPSVRDGLYVHNIYTGASIIDTLFSDSSPVAEHVPTYSTTIRVQDIASINYNIVWAALRKFPRFKFNVLKQYFPNLESTREFITDEHYLGDIRIRFTGPSETIPTKDYYLACVEVAAKIDESLSKVKETYEGSSEFDALPFREVFKDKRVHYSNPYGEGAGISQNDPAVSPHLRIDLSKEDWYVFTDNFGTSEEKEFVAYFRANVKRLLMKYNMIYLVRNERQMAIYSFTDGERFEPDFLLLLQRKKGDHVEQYQIFIEPKGKHLMDKDRWKEEFLLRIEREGRPVTRFFDDNKYLVWGFPFFNSEQVGGAFTDSMNRL